MTQVQENLVEGGGNVTGLEPGCCRAEACSNVDMGLALILGSVNKDKGVQGYG